MKYVMFQTPEGFAVPVIFPDRIVHVAMVESLKNLGQIQGLRLQAVSAGFTTIAPNATYGESESTGFKSKESDATIMALHDVLPPGMPIDNAILAGLRRQWIQQIRESSC